MTLPFTETPGALLLPGDATARAVRGEAGSAAVVVLGLDLSLRRTGLATAMHAESLVPPAQLTGFARLRWIRSTILGRLAGVDHVVVEGLSYGSHTPSALERAGLWHLVMVAIDARGIGWTEVAPKSRAKYATGNGNAGKDEVLAAAIKRLPQAVRNNDEADASWLCAIGYDLRGRPICDLPAVQRAAIDKHRLTTDAGSA